MSTLDPKLIPKMKVADLKVELGKLGLSKSGLKNDLVERLLQAIKGTKSSETTTSETDDVEEEEETEVRKGKRTKSGGLTESKKRKQNEEDSTQDLKKSTDDIGQTLEFNRIRIGPGNIGMKVCDSKQTVNFSPDNLEISSTKNSYSYYPTEYSYVKADVSLRSGQWFYEIRLTSARYIQLGWCTNNFTTKGTGDYWVFSTYDQHKQRNNQAYTRYGEYCSQNDIIGCGLDVDTKTMRFWKNGKDMGVAFNDVAGNGSTEEALTPFAGLASDARITFNFGKSSFSYPQEGYNPIHSLLSDSQIKQLGELYVKYQDIGNKDEEEKKDSIHGNGLIEFQKDLGATEDEDPTILIIAWKLKAKTLWELSKDEFMNGFIINGCSTIAKIKSAVTQWKKDLKTKDPLFKSFYNFVFDYLREEKTILGLEEALTAWKIVFKDRHWNMMDSFREFLEKTSKKAITRDAWQQLWHFMSSYPENLSSYDSSSCWPILYDDFVEYMQEKEKEKEKAEKSKK